MQLKQINMKKPNIEMLVSIEVTKGIAKAKYKLTKKIKACQHGCGQQGSKTTLRDVWIIVVASSLLPQRCQSTSNSCKV